MFLKMPPPLEHVLVVEEGSYQTFIMELYSQWTIRLKSDDNNEINLLSYIGEAVETPIFVVIQKVDNWTTWYYILYTNEEDYLSAYAMSLLAQA